MLGRQHLWTAWRRNRHKPIFARLCLEFCWCNNNDHLHHEFLHHEFHDNHSSSRWNHHHSSAKPNCHIRDNYDVPCNKFHNNHDGNGNGNGNGNGKITTTSISAFYWSTKFSHRISGSIPAAYGTHFVWIPKNTQKNRSLMVRGWRSQDHVLRDSAIH